jgi:hypothetical protein
LWRAVVAACLLAAILAVANIYRSTTTAQGPVAIEARASRGPAGPPPPPPPAFEPSLTLFTVLRDDVWPDTAEVALSPLAAFRDLLEHDRAAALAIPSWLTLNVGITAPDAPPPVLTRARLLQADVIAFGSSGSCWRWNTAMAALARGPSQWRCVPHPCLHLDVPTLDCTFDLARKVRLHTTRSGPSRQRRWAMASAAVVSAPPTAHPACPHRADGLQQF